MDQEIPLARGREIRLPSNKESRKELNREFWGAVIGPWSVRAINRLQVRDFATFGVVVLVFCLSSLAVYHAFIKDEPWVRYNRIYEKKESVAETHKAEVPESKSNGIGTYYPDGQVSSGVNSHGPDRIYSYTKQDGGTGYTNTAPPADGKSVRERPELVADRIEMPIEIQDGRIYVPVSIEHRGNKFDTSFMLDLGAANTILPQRNADFVKANHLTKATYRITEGEGTFYEMRELEHFRVGPNFVQNFRVVTRIGDGATQRGVLGQDFLSRFKFHVDESRRVIVWYH
jgi:hypothetical protein